MENPMLEGYDSAYLESRVFAGRDEHARIGGPRDAVDGRDVAAQGGDEPASFWQVLQVSN
jgi:hypothetical protein